MSQHENLVNHQQGEFLITTDKSKLDLDMIHQYLSQEAYWCKGIPRENVERNVQNSLNFCLFHINQQIGYARVVSDFSSIAYLGDVFILEAHRGQGLSKWLVEMVMGHPLLQGLRRWILLTSDAHELYRKFGWSEIKEPDLWMEWRNLEAYQ